MFPIKAQIAYYYITLYISVAFGVSHFRRLVDDDSTKVSQFLASWIHSARHSVFFNVSIKKKQNTTASNSRTDYPFQTLAKN